MNKKSKSVTAPDQTSMRLKELAKEIAASYTEAGEMIATAQRQGLAALKIAIGCGTLLNEAKLLVEHGDWTEWVEKHCVGVTVRTARNYMRLASKRKMVSDLTDCNTLKKAYIEVGIIPESPRKAIKAPPHPARRPSRFQNGARLK